MVNIANNYGGAEDGSKYTGHPSQWPTGPHLKKLENQFAANAGPSAVFKDGHEAPSNWEEAKNPVTSMLEENFEARKAGKNPPHSDAEIQAAGKKYADSINMLRPSASKEKPLPISHISDSRNRITDQLQKLG